MKQNSLQYIALTKNELEVFIENDSTCIEKIYHRIHIVFPPHGLANGKEALKNSIENKQIGFYEKDLGGIVLGIKNIKILDHLWKIRHDCCALHFDIEANFYVFKPKAGIVIEGLCIHKAKNHMSVVLYRVFNVAIRFKEGTDVSDIMINSNVKFTITDINLKTQLPYIVGELIRKPNKNQKKLDSVNKINKKLIFSDDENMDSGISTEDLLIGEKNQYKNSTPEQSSEECFESQKTQTLKSILKKPSNTPINIKLEKLSQSPPPSPSKLSSQSKSKRISFIINSLDEVNIKKEHVSTDEEYFKNPSETEEANTFEKSLKCKTKKSKRKSFDAFGAISDLIPSINNITEHKDLQIESKILKNDSLKRKLIHTNLVINRCSSTENSPSKKFKKKSTSTQEESFSSSNEENVKRPKNAKKNLSNMLKTFMTNGVNQDALEKRDNQRKKIKQKSPEKSLEKKQKSNTMLLTANLLSEASTAKKMSNEPILHSKTKKYKCKNTFFEELSSISLDEIKLEKPNFSPQDEIVDKRTLHGNQVNDAIDFHSILSSTKTAEEHDSNFSNNFKQKKKKKNHLLELSKLLLNEF